MNAYYVLGTGPGKDSSVFQGFPKVMTESL